MYDGGARARVLGARRSCMANVAEERAVDELLLDVDGLAARAMGGVPLASSISLLWIRVVCIRRRLRARRTAA